MRYPLPFPGCFILMFFSFCLSIKTKVKVCFCFGGAPLGSRLLLSLIFPPPSLLIRLHATICSNQIALTYITGHTCVRWTIDCHGRACCCETLCTVQVAAANMANSYLNFDSTPPSSQTSLLAASIFRSISMSAVEDVCASYSRILFTLNLPFPGGFCPSPCAPARASLEIVDHPSFQKKKKRKGFFFGSLSLSS